MRKTFLKILILSFIALSFFEGCKTNVRDEVVHKRIVGLGIDSAKVTYKEYDITQFCYDCEPYFEAWLSFDTSTNLDINNKLILVTHARYHDTLYMAISDRSYSENTRRLYLTRHIDWQTTFGNCGYYETATIGYYFLKDGIYHLVDTSTKEYRMLKKQPWFEVSTAHNEYILVP